MINDRAARLREAAGRAFPTPANPTPADPGRAQEFLRVGAGGTQQELRRQAEAAKPQGAGREVQKARIEIEESHRGDPPDSLAKEVGADQVQHKMNVAQQQGYFGEVQDDTPNHHYSVEGQARKLPTPEAPLPPVKQD